jgi:Fe-S oxidoreductase
MCHHADLVTTLERRETYSARGRALTLFAIEQGKAQWDSEVADVMYRFFVDGLCRHVCAGHIRHDEMVVDARSKLVAAGQAPPAVRQAVDNIEKTGNPWGEQEPDLRALTQAKLQQDVLVYFGSTARIRRLSTVKALTTLLNEAGVSFSVLADEGDPGLLLHQLGEAGKGAAAAKALAGKLRESGARTIITPDADAYQTFKVGFGERPPLSGIEILHASEFLGQRTGELRFHTPAHTSVAYHDPCALARFAPCLEAPRSVMQTVCGAAPREIGIWSRDLANCSGECGGVPFTQPALSQKSATRRVSEAFAAGAKLIVTGSPAAAVALEGKGLDVRELCEFVADCLA